MEGNKIKLKISRKIVYVIFLLVLVHFLFILFVFNIIINCEEELFFLFWEKIAKNEDRFNFLRICKTKKLKKKLEIQKRVFAC